MYFLSKTGLSNWTPGVQLTGLHWRKGIMVFNLYFKIQNTTQSYDIPDDFKGETSQTEGETLLHDTGLPVCTRQSGNGGSGSHRVINLATCLVIKKYSCLWNSYM